MKRITTAFVVLATAALLLHGLALGQGSLLNLVGNGARASAMGNAFVGVADDATAISWNPAGLTVLRSAEASVVGRMKTGNIEFDFPAAVTNLYNVEVTRESQFQLNFLSGVFPFGERVVGGVALRTYWDPAGTTTWKLSPKSGTNAVEQKEEITGGVPALSPSIAVRVTPNLAVGATANILNGTITSRNESSGPLNTDWDETESTASGTFFDVGFLFNATPRLTAGASFSTGFDLEETDGKYSDSNGTSTSTTDYTMTVPGFWSAGIGFRASDNLLIAADYRARPWSSAEGQYQGDMKGNLELEDANSIHLGLEYLLMSGTSVIPLRFGFYTNPQQFTAYDPNAPDGKGDQVQGGVLTLGGGLIMGRLSLDVAAEFGVLEYEIQNTLGGGVKEATTVTDTDVTVSVGGVYHFGQQ